MKTFRIGGVHPAENKLSAGKAIREAGLPGQAVFPLSQHIGAPAQAVVKAGDRVKCGDVIGEIPEQGLGARIHASMDGVVKSVDGAVVIGK